MSENNLEHVSPQQGPQKTTGISRNQLIGIGVVALLTSCCVCIAAAWIASNVLYGSATTDQIFENIEGNLGSSSPNSDITLTGYPVIKNFKTLNGWKFYVVDVNERSLGGGWKDIEVILAYENIQSGIAEPANANHVIIREMAKIKTDGGYYDAEDIEGGMWGALGMPPGVIIRGSQRGCQGEVKDTDPMILHFKIGSTLAPQSINVNGQTLDLKNPSSISFPGNIPDSALTTFNQEVYLSNGLQVKVTDIQQKGNSYTFNATATNSNKGEDMPSGMLHVMIIGSDGVAYTTCFKGLGIESEIGPLQSVNYAREEIVLPSGVTGVYAIAFVYHKPGTELIHEAVGVIKLQ